MTGSNCRHPRCKRGALPTELIARRDVPIGHFRQASSHHPVPAFGGGEEKSHRLRRLVGQGDKNPATVGWVRLTQEKAVVGQGAYTAERTGGGNGRGQGRSDGGRVRTKGGRTGRSRW